MKETRRTEARWVCRECTQEGTTLCFDDDTVEVMKQRVSASHRQTHPQCTGNNLNIRIVVVPPPVYTHSPIKEYSALVTKQSLVQAYPVRAGLKEQFLASMEMYRQSN